MKVRGYCPMGCGETLHVLGGTITCGTEDCPEPEAVTKILADPETEHLAAFTETGVSVQHPLRERIDGLLFECNVLDRLRALGGPPEDGEGGYRVTEHVPDAYSESYRSDDNGLDLEKIADA